MLPQGEPDDAEVFDFLDEYTRDVEAQRAHPLAHYLRRYPGHEEAIAREFLARQEREHTSSAAPSVDAHGGERRIGPYRLLRELGRGGQGAVWLVEDTRIARKVALKFLPQSFALMSVDARRRLQREAEVVSRLEHPSICPVYEALIDGETPYIAMRFVEGETLASAIASVKKNRAASSHESTTLALGSRNGADIRRVLVFFERAARALHAAHEAGVIHRDIKPGNLMVSRDGEPVVLDFGQARDEHAALSEMTISGEVVGTPAYMSPEQVTGSARAVDRRTDVWSLGASLYEALTLERPFAGRTVTDLMLAIQTRPLRSARELNPAIGDELAVVLETALEKDVHRRYASALELAEDLRRIREYEPIRARPAGPILRTRRWIRRNPALTAVMVALTAGLSSSLYLLRKEQDALAGKAAALGATQDALQGKADALADTEEALNGKAAALADAEAKLIDALGRHLAGRANDLLDQDSSASLILGIQAVQYAPNYQTRAALLSALGECRLATLLEPTPLEPDPPQLFIALDVGRDSRVVAAGLEDGTAHVFSLADGKEIARTSVRACELGQIRLDRECAQIVTSASDGFVRVWNAKSGELLRTLPGPGSDMLWMEFDEAGEQLLALDRNGNCEIWHTADWSRRCELRAEPQSFGCARFSPDGRLVLMSSVWSMRANAPKSPVAVLWSVETARAIGQLSGHTGAITSATFGSSGSLAATSSEDGTARLWRVPCCQPASAPFEHGTPVTCARLSPDESLLATGTDADTDSSAFVWNIAERARKELHGGHRDKIVTLGFSPDGASLLSVSSDSVLQVWSTHDGRERMHSSARVAPLDASWTPDGRRIVVLGTAPSAPVWYGEDPPDVYSLLGHEAAVTRARFSPDGQCAITASADGTARVWATPTWQAPRGKVAPGSTSSVLGGRGVHVTDVMFGAAPKTVITLARGGVIGCWDMRTGELLDRQTVDGEALSASVARQREEDGDAGHLAVVTSSGRVHVFTLGRKLSPRRVIDDAATCAHFSDDGKWLVVGRSDCALRTYDAATLEQTLVHTWSLSKQHDPRDEPGVVDFSIRADGGQFALACRDHRIRVFEALEPEPTYNRRAFAMQDIAYDRDGRQLVVSGPNGRGAIRLYNMPSYRLGRPFEVQHTDDFTKVAFSADGSMLLTASRDGTVFVRQAADGAPVVHLVGHHGPILDAAFSTDGGPLRVITASADGTARVWPVDPLEPAIARRPRELADWELAREKRLALPLEYR